MNPEEYANLERVEKEHWFYAGKREIAAHWLAHYGVLNSKKLLVDCGAGTGRFAAELQSRCRVIAIDDHEESLEIARRLLGREHVLRGSCEATGLADASTDAVTALDVLEHVPDDAKAATELHRILKPGGILVVTVPAFQALWSDWDVALHHYRRYRRPMLARVLRGAGFELLHISYINVIAFPAVFAIRKLRALFPIPTAAGTRAEEKLPPAWLNRILRKTFVGPACQKVLPFPFGVGLLAVAQRRSQ
jgi:SAM-dependent methyltransferase